MDVDIYAIISLVLRVVAVGIVLFYIIPKQFLEATRPKDWLTGLRWKILFLVIFMILSSLPVISYQKARIDGDVTNAMRNIASISSNLSYLSMTVLLVLIYNYRNTDGVKIIKAQQSQVSKTKTKENK